LDTVLGKLLLLQKHHLHGLLLAAQFDRIYGLHVIFSEDVIHDVLLFFKFGGEHLVAESRISLHDLLLLGCRVEVLPFFNVLISITRIHVLINESFMMSAAFPLVFVGSIMLIGNILL
jgi:hypothetical protein